MFIHRENALKAHQHTCTIYHIVLYKESMLKKNNFNTKWDQNIHQDTSNCTFFKNFSRSSMALCMCAADIIISIRKEPFFSFRMQSKYTLNPINYDMFSKNFPGAITNLIENKSL